MKTYFKNLLFLAMFMAILPACSSDDDNDLKVEGLDIVKPTQENIQSLLNPKDGDRYLFEKILKKYKRTGWVCAVLDNNEIKGKELIAKDGIYYFNFKINHSNFISTDLSDLWSYFCEEFGEYTLDVEYFIPFGFYYNGKSLESSFDSNIYNRPDKAEYSLTHSTENQTEIAINSISINENIEYYIQVFKKAEPRIIEEGENMKFFSSMNEMYNYFISAIREKMGNEFRLSDFKKAFPYGLGGLDYKIELDSYQSRLNAFYPI